jgi:hypothetical protein
MGCKKHSARLVPFSLHLIPLPPNCIGHNDVCPHMLLEPEYRNAHKAGKGCDQQSEIQVNCS